MIRADQLDIDRACVLVIDVQEKLLPLIDGQDRLVAATTKLLRGAAIFQLPVVTTEQYPKGLGRTVPAITSCLKHCNNVLLEKMTFSAIKEPGVRKILHELDRPQVILVGIETHVCIQQTALDLKTQDYDVFVCADATGSRNRFDFDCGLERLRQAQIIVTTAESALFELCNRCDTAEFKRMIDVVKGDGHDTDQRGS